MDKGDSFIFARVKDFMMGFLDTILAVLVIYGFVRGLWNGFFVELASLLSLIVGVYIAIKFSYLVKAFLAEHVSWEPKTIQITAFAITFILVVIGIGILAKSFTVIANFASLGLLNKLLGGIFGVLKTILIISITLNLFQKLNSNNTFIEKATIDKSRFYNPILEVSKMIYPKLEEWFEDLKNTTPEEDKK